jgi:hypothetical protein
MGFQKISLLVYTIISVVFIFSCSQEQDQAQIPETTQKSDLDESDEILINFTSWVGLNPNLKAEEQTDFNITLEPLINLSNTLGGFESTYVESDTFLIIENGIIKVYKNKKIVLDIDLQSELLTTNPEIIAVFDDNVIIQTDEQFLIVNVSTQTPVFQHSSTLKDLLVRQSKLILHVKDISLGEGEVEESINSQLVSVDRNSFNTEWETELALISNEIYYDNGLIYGISRDEFISVSVETGMIKEQFPHSYENLDAWYLTKNSQRELHVFLQGSRSYEYSQLQIQNPNYQIESNKELDALQSIQFDDSILLVSELDNRLFISMANQADGSLLWQRELAGFAFLNVSKDLIHLKRGSEVLILNAYDGSTEFYSEFRSDDEVTYYPGAYLIGSQLYQLVIEAQASTISRNPEEINQSNDEMERLLSPIQMRFEYNHLLWPYRAAVKPSKIPVYRTLDKEGVFFIEMQAGDNLLRLEASLQGSYLFENLSDSQFPLTISLLDEQGTVINSNITDAGQGAEIAFELNTGVSFLNLQFIKLHQVSRAG